MGLNGENDHWPVVFGAWSYFQTKHQWLITWLNLVCCGSSGQTIIFAANHDHIFWGIVAMTPFSDTFQIHIVLGPSRIGWVAIDEWMTAWWWLEPWNFMTFHIIWECHHNPNCWFVIFFREVFQPPTRSHRTIHYPIYDPIHYSI